MIDILHPQVTHLMAASAYKMMMLRHISIKMIRAVTGRNLPYLSQLREERQITVYGSQTDPGLFFSKTTVNGLGSGMILPPGQKIFDGFSLSAVF